MVLPQIARIIGTSKLVFIPATVLTLGGGGLFLITYKVSRYTSSTLLSVNADNTHTTTSSTCLAASSITALAPVAVFLIARHRRYNPPSFSQTWQQMKNVINNNYHLNHVQHELTTHTTVTSTGHKTIIQPLSRTEAIKEIIGRPIRFYMYNVFISAAILGIGTSVTQRAICGKSKPLTEKKIKNKISK